MSTTERVVDNKFAKRLVIINALVPGALLVWDALRHHLGVDDVNFAIRTTGLVGLVLLVLTLLVTPLRKLTGWTALIAVRRNLGVIGFGYIAAHFMIFFWWDQDGSVTSTLREIVLRVYLWFGFGALLLMIPLAITSTDGMVARLGAKRWKRLHWLVYPAVIGGAIHYILLVKSDIRQPAVFAGVLGAALAYRIAAKLRPAPAKPKAAFWSGDLKLARITQETPDVRTFRFVNPAGGALPFEHTAGQYLNLPKLRRSYTIASPPTRRDYCEISVKRGAGVSAHLHDTWKEGDRVRIAAPSGKFVFAGHEAPKVVLLAGGIGVTPMMSVIRSLTDRAWTGDILLVYSVRKVADIAFRDELADLAARHKNLRVTITVTGDPDAAWDGARGPIRRELLAGVTSGPILVCGPDAMMTAMRALLVGMGIPDADVHQEAFVSPPARSEAPAPGTDEPPLSDGETVTLAFAKSGAEATVGDTTVLEAAEAAGVDIPFECRSGICGQCKTRLVSGNVRMDATDALSARDRERGLILACQARPTRDCVVDA